MILASLVFEGKPRPMISVIYPPLIPPDDGVKDKSCRLYVICGVDWAIVM